MHIEVTCVKRCLWVFSFYVHSQSWWAGGNTNREGNKIDDLLSSLNLSQIISEPSNFTPNSLPSWIDLIVTDQPNIILNSGTRPSLDPKCHHQIVHCKANISIPIPPPCERKICNYHNADTGAIQRSLSKFPWEQH
jgi:hypothetical protein